MKKNIFLSDKIIFIIFYILYFFVFFLGWILSTDNDDFNVNFPRGIMMYDERFKPVGYEYGIAQGIGCLYTGLPPIPNHEWSVILFNFFCNFF